LAFLVWVEFSDYGGQIECRGRVLHTLIGRYVPSVICLTLCAIRCLYYVRWSFI